MSDAPAIVVLTPLKNDAWILRRFLEVTSLFADRIVIADQGSTDGSLEICREFEKVTVIENKSAEYDEAARQQLLIDTARSLVPLPRILVALDADEVLAADAMTSPDWHQMLAQPPGTLVLFEKPNLYLSTDLCERRPLDFPGAFVDDGSPHTASRIHSPRLPRGTTTFTAGGVKFLHYALVRPEAQKAKMRMYAALENVMGTKTLYWRRRYYWSKKVFRTLGPIEPSPEAWFAGWEQRGIDMRTIDDRRPYWQDVATLDLLLQHGSRRFWYDDVWEKDWNAFARELGRDAKVSQPPRLIHVALNAAQSVLEAAARLKRRS